MNALKKKLHPRNFNIGKAYAICNMVEHTEGVFAGRQQYVLPNEIRQQREHLIKLKRNLTIVVVVRNGNNEILDPDRSDDDTMIVVRRTPPSEHEEIITQLTNCVSIPPVENIEDLNIDCLTDLCVRIISKKAYVDLPVVDFTSK
jgi:hypothetical protein